MKVNSYLFGEIDVNPETVLTFPQGLAGFEDKTRYTMVHEAVEGEAPTSYTLQSLEDPALALQIVDPTLLGFDYHLLLNEAEESAIEFDDNAEVAVMLVINKSESGELGANIKAPLVINIKKRLGLQKITTRLRPNVLLSEVSQGL
jgi:flagellar assembly factor FliW